GEHPTCMPRQKPADDVPAGSERRKHARVETKIPFRLLSGGQEEAFDLVDLSEAGVRIRCRRSLGAMTRIQVAMVLPGKRIGAGTVLGQNVFVARGVSVGRGCKVQNNVSLYEGVTLEDDVFVGPSAVFTNVRHPRAHVSRRHAFEATLVRRHATIGANATIVCGVTLG